MNERILLIDDEVELLNLIETVLRKEGFENIFKAKTALDGIEMCKIKSPDIIVLDIMLPDIDGFEACKKIREITYSPIIFLSAKSEDIDKILALGLGGDDYVTKPFSPKELAFRIKAHLRRIDYMKNTLLKENKTLKFGDIEINEEKSIVLKKGKEIELKAKEYQLLLYMAKNINQILSKEKLFEQVWGEESIGYDNTIMVHIRRIREKIENEPSNPEYIKTIKGLGYKLVSKED
ncbi:signal transduction response regulator [Gottschalkia purinilytica]|uniref:Signal transduction response regulator n=1 Tax=Gottschalkia purinilytica TaxID=1503 RepID=A0A0L0WA82_GOTPU|nr:response regulator transcription factor [Gottschalkia purinilytica]KNF08200.1 signal transduction response regulator [Gottschalkia purinilytica]